MTQIIRDNIRNNNTLRNSFCELAENTFGIDFKPWYEGGFWGEKYIPHVITEGESVIANVSVNLMDFVYGKEKKRFVQLGTVMTRQDRRGRGLSRQLLEEVTDRWKDQCDGMYLHANAAVLGFYPQFGFAPAEEFVYKACPEGRQTAIRKLDMSKKADVELLLKRYAQGNPYAEIAVADNPGLLMFYCAGPSRDNIYDLPQLGVVVVMSRQGPMIQCHDIYGGKCGRLAEVVQALCAEAATVELGFTPVEKECFQAELLQEDSTLFVLRGKAHPLAGKQARLPSLSQA